MRAKLALIACCLGIVASLLTTKQSHAADCALPVADELRTAGLLDQAETAYLEALKADPSNQCAINGLKDLAGRRSTRDLDIAAALQKAGLNELAIEFVKAALQADPHATIPPALVAVYPGSRGFNLARSLEQAGFHDAAKDIFTKTVEGDPGAKIPDDLQFLGSSSGTWWWQGFARAVAPWLATGGELLFLLVTVGLIGWIGFRLVRLVIRPRLLIEDFGGASAEVGKAMSSLTRAAFRWLDDATGGGRLEMADGADAMEIPAEVSDPFPQTKVLGGLVRFLLLLLPSRVHTLSGYLHERDDKVVGLTLFMQKRSGRIEDQVTLWEHDALPQHPETDPRPDYYRYAEPAAVWAALRLKSSDADFTLLGTRDWKSYVKFTSGADYQELGQIAEARTLYSEALRHDPINYGALFNQTILQVSDVSPRVRRNEDEVREVIATLARIKAAAASWQNRGPFWYRVAYMLAAVEMNDRSSAGGGAAPLTPLPEILTHTRELSVAVERVLIRRPGTGSRGPSRSLYGYLEGIEKAVLILHAGVLSMSPVRAGQMVDGPTPTREQVLYEVELDLITDGRLIDYVLGLGPMNERAWYNLACYNAGLRRNRQALGNLESALLSRDPNLIRAAKGDPSFRRVATDRATRARFKRITTETPASGHPAGALQRVLDAIRGWCNSRGTVT